MARYQIWDKTSDVYTPSGERFTPAQWLARYPWADIEGAKMVITTGIINGGCAMEFGATKEMYHKMGAAIMDGMTDGEVLAAIEEFEDNPPVDPTPSAEERIAAALEFQSLMSLPDE